MPKFPHALARFFGRALHAVILPAVTALSLSGCAGLTSPGAGSAEAAAEESVINDVTAAGKWLAGLPRAKERPVVAVYSFDDKTGQRKPSDDLVQTSTAVTQGGADILTKALLDAARGGWFRVAERGGLDGLTKERQIIRMMRDQYAASDGTRLPPPRPMLYAGALLDGGVIAYESNILTGGIGARYLGVGGDVKYRRDMVTVNLRAVSVQTGEVLLSVNAAKTIYSSGVSAGVFKFVAFDKLLESEAGYTYNEPPQLAVRQAVESAVGALIMEGYARGLWNFADRRAGDKAYRDYLKRTGLPYVAPAPQGPPPQRTISQRPQGNVPPQRNMSRPPQADIPGKRTTIQEPTGSKPRPSVNPETPPAPANEVKKAKNEGQKAQEDNSPRYFLPSAGFAAPAPAAARLSSFPREEKSVTSGNKTDYKNNEK